MENLTRMLEQCMGNMGILVVACSNYAVLYKNKAFQAAFPDMKEGQNGLLVMREAGCEELVNVLSEMVESDKKLHKAMRVHQFGGMTDIRTDHFMWQGTTESLVITFSPHMLSEEERLDREVERAMGGVLTEIYPLMALVNISKDRLIVLESSGGFQLPAGDRTSYSGGFLGCFASYIHPDDEELFAEKTNREYLLQTFGAGNKEVHMELQMVKTGGGYHWVAVRFVRVLMEETDGISCIILMRDIDYRMKQKEKLQSTLDATYSAIPGGIVEYLLDDKLTIVSMNDAFCELMEKTPDDYAGGYREHIHPDDEQRVMDIVYAAGREGKPFDVVYRVKTGRSGMERWVQCRGVKTGEKDGYPVYLAIRLDVSELKNTQTALLEEQVRADLAMGSNGSVRFEYDCEKDDMTFYYQLPDAPGIMQKEVMHKYCKELLTEEEVYKEDTEKLRAVCSGNGRNPAEVRFYNRVTNRYEWFRVKGSDITELSGKKYVVGIIENIESQKQLEAINTNLQEEIEFVIRDAYRRMYLIDVKSDKCKIVYMGADSHKRPVQVSFSKLVDLCERSRVHLLDKDNCRAKYLYLTSKSALNSERGELYFDARIRDGFGPEYHWYTFLIKPLKDGEGRFVCLMKNVDEAKQQEELARKLLEQEKYQKFSEKIIDSLGILVEFRDGDSGSHIMRTRQLTGIILNYLRENGELGDLPADKIEKICTAAAMHDVGKISISDAILNKPGKLTADEFELMKEHTVKGWNILKKLDMGQDEDFTRYCLDICRWHHERYDGGGYPDRLKGDEIPIWSQIVGLVDVYDALVSPRVYKGAYSHEKAMEMIVGGECGCFSPQLLNGLKACAGNLRACYE